MIHGAFYWINFKLYLKLVVQMEFRRIWSEDLQYRVDSKLYSLKRNKKVPYEIKKRFHKGHLNSTLRFINQNNICAIKVIIGNVIAVRNKKITARSMNETGILEPSNSPPTSDK